MTGKLYTVAYAPEERRFRLVSCFDRWGRNHHGFTEQSTFIKRRGRCFRIAILEDNPRTEHPNPALAPTDLVELIDTT